MHSFCIGVDGEGEPPEDSRGLEERLNEFLAFVKKDAARVTELPLRFLPPPETGSALVFFAKGPDEIVFFSLVVAAGSSAMTGGRFGPEAPECVTGSAFSLGGLVEPPNILFSNPPWLEKLLRLFPASLNVQIRTRVF